MDHLFKKVVRNHIYLISWLNLGAFHDFFPKELKVSRLLVNVNFNSHFREAPYKQNPSTGIYVWMTWNIELYSVSVKMFWIKYWYFLYNNPFTHIMKIWIWMESHYVKCMGSIKIPTRYLLRRTRVAWICIKCCTISSTDVISPEKVYLYASCCK